MLCSSRIVSGMLPEIHPTEKFDSLKSIIHSQIISFSVISMSIRVFSSLEARVFRFPSLYLAVEGRGQCKDYIGNTISVSTGRWFDHRRTHIFTISKWQHNLLIQKY